MGPHASWTLEIFGAKVKKCKKKTFLKLREFSHLHFFDILPSGLWTFQNITQGVPWRTQPKKCDPIFTEFKGVGAEISIAL